MFQRGRKQVRPSILFSSNLKKTGYCHWDIYSFRYFRPFPQLKKKPKKQKRSAVASYGGPVVKMVINVIACRSQRGKREGGLAGEEDELAASMRHWIWVQIRSIQTHLVKHQDSRLQEIRARLDVEPVGPVSWPVFIYLVPSSHASVWHSSNMHIHLFLPCTGISSLSLSNAFIGAHWYSYISTAYPQNVYMRYVHTDIRTVWSAIISFEQRAFLRS